jgi:exopolysaccharide biosynthesis polyprenyl glycosylphosphotransferase
MKRKIFQFTFSLIYPAVDFLVVALSIMASYKIYRILEIGEGVIYQKTEILPISLLIALMSVLVMSIFGVYKKESSVLNAEEIKNTVKGATAAYVLFMVFLVFGGVNLSRYVMILSYFTSLILLVVEKTVFYHFPFRPSSIRRLHERVLIYGAGDLGIALYREFVNSPKFNIIPVGFIDDNPRKNKKIIYQSGFYNEIGIPVVGVRKDIPRLMEEMDIDQVFVAISNVEYQALIDIINYLKNHNIKVAFVPNLYKLFVHKIKINQIGQLPLVQVEESAAGFYVRFIKRWMDLVLSTFILLILSPLILLIAIAIRIDSRGPVFFKQNRVGKNGKVFQIYKFRSMVTEADPYAINPLHQKDPRITRVGRFLRKISLDELPQIFNVLKGEMSLVGPRPEMPFIVATYNELHRERLAVIPGITGLWQLSGDRKKAIHENMDYDIYYIRNISFFLDIAILIETMIFAFRGI